MGPHWYLAQPCHTAALLKGGARILFVCIFEVGSHLIESLSHWPAPLGWVTD